VSSGIGELTHQERHTWSATREVAPVAVLYTLATALLGVLLGRFLEPIYVLRWTLISTVLLAAVLWRLFRFLPENYHVSTQVIYHSLGPANHVTLLRGVLLVWLAGFVFLTRPASWLGYVPAILYTTAIFLDGLDGLLARLTRRITKLGQRLDIELDGLGILAASALGIVWSQLPVWYVLVALAYYAFTLGLWLRRRLGLAVHPLPPIANRRLMAGIQMGFVSAILWPVLPPVLTTLAAALIAVPFLAGFVRDWLFTSGVLDVNSPSYQAWSGRLTAVVQRWLPVPVRLAVLVVFVLNFLQTGHLAFFEQQPLAGAAWLALLGMLVGAGIAGRTAGMLLAIFISLAAARWGVTQLSLILMGCGLTLLLFGSGALSVWQPDETLLQRRARGQS
jgi:CDP-diacylglycerol--glycerol-3-phosphate 3-phosphatidyltransferase